MAKASPFLPLETVAEGDRLPCHPARAPFVSLLPCPFSHRNPPAPPIVPCRQWHRNQDGVAIAADDVFIMQDPTACKNRLGQWPIVETGLTGPRVSGSLRQGAAAPAAAPATSLQQTSAAAGRRSLH